MDQIVLGQIPGARKAGFFPTGCGSFEMAPDPVTLRDHVLTPDAGGLCL